MLTLCLLVVFDCDIDPYLCSVRYMDMQLRTLSRTKVNLTERSLSARPLPLYKGLIFAGAENDSISGSGRVGGKVS